MVPPDTSDAICSVVLYMTQLSIWFLQLRDRKNSLEASDLSDIYLNCKSKCFEIHKLLTLSNSSSAKLLTTWNSPWARRREHIDTPQFSYNLNKFSSVVWPQRCFFPLLWMKVKTGWNSFLGARARIPGFFPWIDGRMAYNKTQVSLFPKIFVWI